jgi:hypothetical protein
LCARRLNQCSKCFLILHSSVQRGHPSIRDANTNRASRIANKPTAVITKNPMPLSSISIDVDEMDAPERGVPERPAWRCARPGRVFLNVITLKAHG